MEKLIRFFKNLQEYYEVAGEVATVNKKTRAGQLARILFLRIKNSINANDYAYYNLANHTLVEASRFLNKNQLNSILLQLNPDPHRDVVVDKMKFYQHCLEHGLDTVPVSAILLGSGNPVQCLETRAQIISTAGQLETYLVSRGQLASPLIFKLLSGSGGVSSRCIYFKNGGAVDERGEPVIADSLWLELFENPSASYISQEMLSVEPSLRDVMPGEALGTFRLVSRRTDENVELLYAFAKLPSVGNFVDNFNRGDAGNLLAAVDLNTGCFGRAWYKKPEHDYVLSTTSRHPSNKMLIEGAAIPRWSEVIEQVKRAALSFKKLQCLGWDVAITDAGIFILEANSLHDPDGPQVTRQTGLANVYLS